MALILNSAGFTVFIQCENDQGHELGWNGGPISPGVTRYIQADRIEGNGGSCLCCVYGVDSDPDTGTPPWPLITAQKIGPHDLWYFIGGTLTTDSTGLRYTDTSNRQGW
jgi:hypothetical protein